MKLTVKNTRNKDVKIFDMHGIMIPGVKSFDTKTGETELYLRGILPADKSARTVRSKLNMRKGSFIEDEDGHLQTNSEIVVLKTRIKGAYAKINGKIVK